MSPDIVLIDIADDTLSQLGAWPFDREYHSNLIQTLGHFGAKAVIFDILFSEPWENQQSDLLVAQSSAEAQNVYFGMSFSGLKQKKGAWTAEKVAAPVLPAYAAAAKGVGHVNTSPDMDGKRRRTIPVIFHDGKPTYQMVFRAAADIFGAGVGGMRFKPGRYLEVAPGRRVPLDEKGCFIISYAGQWEKSFRHYSFVDIIFSAYQISQGEEPRLPLSTLESLKGKICIVGHAAHGTVDISPIPIQSVYPMVGSYANILNDILMKDFITRLDRWANVLLLLLFGALIVWISTHHKPTRALVLTLAAMTVFAGGAVAVFCAAGWWVDLFYPTIVFMLLYASVTLQRVLHEMKKRELIESELKIASQIQKSFLPASMPEVKGITLAAFFQPAKAVGGDLYAFVKMPSDRQLGVMGGDVSGKGTPAALFMAKTVSEFKFSARDRQDPGQALEQVNNAIASESTGGLFVTMAYAIFDVGEMKMLLSNAGHLPLVSVQKDGAAELLTAAEGMPIGVMDGVPFDTVSRPLKAGEILAFYSDGVSEARNKKKEEYDVQRLKEQLVKHRALSVNEILDKTVEDLRAFMGKADQHDDITLIVVKMDDAA